MHTIAQPLIAWPPCQNESLLSEAPTPLPAVKKPPTLKDIAQELGVAHTTVSRALSGHPRISTATREQVQAAAQRLGYLANAGARAMRSGADRLVGLVVPDMRNEFYSAAATSLAAHCAQAGYRMLLCVSDDDPGLEELQVRTLRESRCAGVLVTPSVAPTPQTVAWLRERPVVQLLRCHPALGKDHALVDDQDGVFRATRHLLDLGHREIGYIGGPVGISTGLRRRNGYVQALRQQGLRADPGLQHLVPPRAEFGAQAMLSLLETRPRLTAVAVTSVRLMLGVFGTLARQGVVVPRDLSLVCYGDAEWFEFTNPPITAVALPVDALARHAAETLFALLGPGPGAGASTTTDMFIGDLRVRGSTAPIHGVQRLLAPSA